MTVTLLYFDGCPNWREAEERVRPVAEELGHTVERHEIATEQDARWWGFAGSPTILVDGRDLFPDSNASAALSCRVYDTPEGRAGVPTTTQLREALWRR